MPTSTPAYFASAGQAAFAFLKCSSASSWSPCLSASSPALYSVAASPRSFPSACAFFIFGRSSFLISIAVSCANSGSARPSTSAKAVAAVFLAMGPPLREAGAAVNSGERAPPAAPAPDQTSGERSPLAGDRHAALDGARGGVGPAVVSRPQNGGRGLGVDGVGEIGVAHLHEDPEGIAERRRPIDLHTDDAADGAGGVDVGVGVRAGGPAARAGGNGRGVDEPALVTNGQADGLDGWIEGPGDAQLGRAEVERVVAVRGAHAPELQLVGAVLGALAGLAAARVPGAIRSAGERATALPQRRAGVRRDEAPGTAVAAIAILADVDHAVAAFRLVAVLVRGVVGVPPRAGIRRIGGLEVPAARRDLREQARGEEGQLRRRREEDQPRVRERARPRKHRRIGLDGTRRRVLRPPAVVVAGLAPREVAASRRVVAPGREQEEVRRRVPEEIDADDVVDGLVAVHLRLDGRLG